MVNRFLWVILLSGFLTSCVSGQSQSDQLNALIADVLVMEYIPFAKLDDDALTDKIKQSVISNLREPESAQFQEVNLVRSQDRAYLCGQLNARNGFGGYTGFQWFFASPISQFFTEDVDFGGTVISHFCLQSRVE